MFMEKDGYDLQQQFKSKQKFDHCRKINDNQW